MEFVRLCFAHPGVTITLNVINWLGVFVTIAVWRTKSDKTEKAPAPDGDSGPKSN
jgi:hypothetical protein